MKKLNNKGMTTVEILLCFVIISVIAVSMFSSITSFNERRIKEEYKRELITYKNLLTKMIQDDLIKIGVMHADISRNINNTTLLVTYTVNFTLKDGSHRILIVDQGLASSYDFNKSVAGVSKSDDYFMIQYGKDVVNGMINYPIPDFGSYENSNGQKVYDLEINNVSMKITEANILDIYIGFSHPELGNQYAISIVCPINYSFSVGENLTF